MVSPCVCFVFRQRNETDSLSECFLSNWPRKPVSSFVHGEVSTQKPPPNPSFVGEGGALKGLLPPQVWNYYSYQERKSRKDETATSRARFDLSISLERSKSIEMKLRVRQPWSQTCVWSCLPTTKMLYSILCLGKGRDITVYCTVRTENLVTSRDLINIGNTVEHKVPMKRTRSAGPYVKRSRQRFSTT